MSDTNSTYEIQRILDQTLINDKPHYLIKWKGYSATEATWQPIENLIQSLDFVHSWKIKNSSHFNQLPKENIHGGLQKKKRIRFKDKEEINKNRKIQKKFNDKNKSKNITIDFDDSQNPTSPQQLVKQLETNFTFAQQSTQFPLSQKIKSNPTSKPKSPKTHEHHSKYKNPKGFKVIGKITKNEIKSVLWCFQWRDKKMCEVQLKDGRKVNMKRTDIKKICPSKLLDYFEKVQKIKLL